MAVAAGFVRTSMAVVTLLGKSSPSPLRPEVSVGELRGAVRRCQVGHCPGHALSMLRCSPGAPGRIPPCSARGFCGCSNAEARFRRVVYTTRGCDCATSNLSLYHSRKRTGIADAQVPPFLNSNLGEMQEMQILRRSLGRTNAPLQPGLPRLVLASAQGGISSCQQDSRTAKPLRLPVFLGMPFWPYPDCKDSPIHWGPFLDLRESQAAL